MRECSINGCAKEARGGGGLCCMHASRLRVHGDVNGGKQNHAPPEERFWRFVDKRGPDDCWLWTGNETKKIDGYGLFGLGKHRAPVLAHRFCYRMHKGEIAEGMFVMHTCDTPKCVNPAHLKLGTPKDNMDDMRAKGRNRHISFPGNANGNALLTEDKVRAIRAVTGRTNRDIAREFGVSFPTIDGIRAGRTWKHLLP